MVPPCKDSALTSSIWPADFANLQHREHCHKNGKSDEFCVYCYAEKLFTEAMQDRATRAPYTPKVLARGIRVLGKQFREGRQEDSHEFLRCLLERMHRCALKVAGVKEGSKDRRDETDAIHNGEHCDVMTSEVMMLMSSLQWRLRASL